MTDADRISLCAEIVRHYPSVTPGDLEILSRVSAAAPLPLAAKALADTRAGQKNPHRPDIPAYRARIAAAMGPAGSKREKLIDSIRRQARADPARPDGIVIHDYFRAMWARAGDSAEPGRSAMRSYIIGSCRRALEEVGWTTQDAHELGMLIVGLEPPERPAIAAMRERGGR